MNLLSKIFKKDKIKDYEIISNPKILFDKNVVAEELKLNGHRIGDSVSLIDFSKIDMTGLEIYPQKIDFSSWREGKTYVTINGKEIEFTLEERKKAVIERDGWLGYENGARFRIENQTITSFSLHEKILTLFNKYSKNQEYLHAEVFAQIDFSNGFVINDRRRFTGGQNFAFTNDVGVITNAQGFSNIVVSDQYANLAIF